MFDGVDRYLQLNYPGSRQVSYEPDELDRIRNIRSGASTIAAYKYIGVGRVKERSYLNGTNLAVQYDGVKRVTDYANNMGANVISQYQYGYDNMFNKLFEQRIHHGKRDDYVYDSLYRLMEYRKDGDLNGNSPAKTIGYTMDGVGNRTRVTENGTPTTYSVNNLNQYTAIGGQAQTYDDNGNLMSDGTRTFSYDYANSLVRIVTATQTINYKHDVFGRRIEKSVDGAITRYYCEGASVIEDRDGADAVSATYVFGNGIDEILTMDRGGQTYYYHTNAQGRLGGDDPGFDLSPEDRARLIRELRELAKRLEGKERKRILKRAMELERRASRKAHGADKAPSSEAPKTEKVPPPVIIIPPFETVEPVAERGILRFIRGFFFIMIDPDLYGAGTRPGPFPPQGERWY